MQLREEEEVAEEEEKKSLQALVATALNRSHWHSATGSQNE